MENKLAYDTNNIFYKIIKGEIPCQKVYEDVNTLAFYDINPAAPIHVLVIPKENFTSFNDFINNSKNIEQFFKTVHLIAQRLNLTQSGYRVLTNIGLQGGQEIPHFHIHILGGKKLGKIG